MCCSVVEYSMCAVLVKFKLNCYYFVLTLYKITLLCYFEASHLRCKISVKCEAKANVMRMIFITYSNFYMYLGCLNIKFRNA